jgi:murein DD-endopeptidase MepM/ murein hydrolase activator NlpD
MGPKHTIVVVPAAEARAHGRLLSRLQWLAGAAVICAFALLAVVASWSYIEVRSARAELARTAQENQRLRGLTRALEDDLHFLRSEFSEYDRRTSELALVAGIELSYDFGESGIGGEAERLDLAEYAAQLGGRLDEIAAGLEARAERTASIPSIAPARGLLTSAYGYRRDPITGARTLHRGIDIGTAANRPVRATADGIVIRAGHNGALGTSVSLSHGFGVVTRYGHLSRLSVEPGQAVTQGDVLGHVGKSGRATGYHLHYEVRLDGRPVNPLDYMRDELTGP